MKKAISLVLILFMFCSFALSVNAEEFNGADLFTVDLPEEFRQTGANVSDFTFTNENGDNFNVSYSDNTQKENIFSPADMNKDEIEEYLNTLSDEATAVMKEYTDDFNMEMSGGEIIKHKSGKKALVFRTKTSIKANGKESLHYQMIYEFGGINNKYTFTYTTADENKIDGFNEVFDSINIFEEETKSNSDKVLTYGAAGLMVFLVFAGIVRFIRTPEKREKGKIK